MKPYVLQPVLLLDSYRCHMMARIVNDIQVLGVEILRIPGACRGLCQPVDIGIGKPLNKTRRACCSALGGVDY